MDLFKLLGTIAIDNKDANKEIDETTQKGSQAQGKLSKSFGAIGKGALAVGKAIGVGMVAAGTAVAGLVTQSVQSYAEYEQLVGGVDTLFKNSSAKVQEYAQNAYKTAGMSANEYMNTVTSFSASLLQSLGGDTDAAAEKANVAITDMSDNANKMGTSMEMIQNAYQGFAKQNYTMLDNLKLGYGGTKEEMQRLLSDAEKISGKKFDLSSYGDVVDAIHVIQTEMGITGTTAAEASGTISGSMASVKGAWSNLVTAIASDDLPFGEYVDNFVNSASTMIENMFPRIEMALSGVVMLVNKLAPMIIEKIPGLLSQLLPPIINAATQLVTSVAKILPSLTDMLVNDILPQLLTGFVEIFNALVVALPQLMQSICTALPTLIPLLVDGLVAMIVTLCTNLVPIIQPLIDNLPAIMLSIQDAFLSNLPILLSAVWQLIVAIFQAIPGYLASCWSYLKDSLALVGSYLGDWLAPAWNAVKNWFSKLWQGVVNVFEKIKNSIRIALEFIGSIFSAAFQIITLPFRFIWENCKEYVFAAFEWIKDKINVAISFIKNLVLLGFNFVKDRIINPIVEAKNKAVEAFALLKNQILERIIAVKNKVSEIFGNIKSKITNTVSNIRSTVSDIFSKIKDAMSKPIEKARDTIKGIVDKIKGFFSGLKIKFPSIKLPHFSIKPSGWKIGDLLKGSIPKLGIDWYAKAMSNPMIMTRPTIFGYDAGTGKLMGGGETGSEVVTGTNTLLNMIQAAVADQNSAVVYYLEKLIDIVAMYFPEVISAMERDVVLDSGAMVGALAVPMNQALGKLSDRKDRGR